MLEAENLPEEKVLELELGMPGASPSELIEELPPLALVELVLPPRGMRPELKPLTIGV